MKKKGRKVLPQSTLSIKKLELEVNKLNESLDSIDIDILSDLKVQRFPSIKDLVRHNNSFDTVINN